jgi:hypothetical protein
MYLSFQLEISLICLHTSIDKNILSSTLHELISSHGSTEKFIFPILAEIDKYKSGNIVQ